MLYSLLKIPAKIAFRIYCRNIIINNKGLLSVRGPLLIAANHPDSFLDAIIIATLFKRPVYSLVRGDVYKNKFFAAILTSLKMLPVFRISEGAENLGRNYSTFEKCKTIFRNNGIILIFSEGRCINEWKLRPLKKGTARLAISSWESGISLKILPAGINYQSFSSFGKNIKLNFGNTISADDIDLHNGYGNTISGFNEKLNKELKMLVAENEKNDKASIRAEFKTEASLLKKILLSFPALAGYLLHAPLYIPLKKYIWKKAAHNDHYDSIITGALFFTYPVYLSLIVALGYTWINSNYWLFLFLLLPFFAWSYVQLKKQF